MVDSVSFARYDFSEQNEFYNSRSELASDALAHLTSGNFITVPERSEPIVEKVVDEALFKRAMGSFVTGVTVVTTEVDGEVHAMTANAFSSLSLHPPLALVCVHEHANMASFLTLGRPFCVNLLSYSQGDLSNYFAGGHKPLSPPSFSFEAFAESQRLSGSLCTVGCSVRDLVKSGDHFIVIGEVQDVIFDDDSPAPLVYYQGKYHSLQAQIV
jgi:flavin reductase (DIM6/NTAB) family NADH-FMN oxidoreductase RutF